MSHAGSRKPRPVLIHALVALAAVATLQSCGKRAQGGANYADSAPAKSDADSKPGPANPLAPAPSAVPLLAYAYSFGVTAPPGSIADLEKRHEAACTSAGVSVCQVLASSQSGKPGDATTAQLEVRASKAWIDRFRAGLSSSLPSVHGQLTSTDVKAEDLTHQIVDAQAAIAARTALRDKLRSMIGDKAARLSDLIELETKLSQVQGEIDQQAADLAVNQERVALSHLTVVYTSADSDRIGASLGRIGSNAIATIALLIDVLSALAPLAALGGCGYLVWRAIRRRRSTQKRDGG